jgi:glycerophosphoryl diester phosphodiesterase
MLAFFSAAPALAFDLQGHRGARGLAPENTLEGFAKALEIGVTTLETDIAVTKDGVLVLYHDRVLNPDITRDAGMAWLSASGPAINTLTFADLARYDVGRIKPESKYAAQFPEQRPVDGARIPTLADLFAITSPSGRPPRFNIETKLSPDHPCETPDPETFSRLVVELVRKAGVSGRTTIQSFDWRTLRAARKLAPEIETVCLTAQTTLRDREADGQRKPSPWLAGIDPADHGGSVPRLVKAAECAVWSPRYAELTAEAVAEAHGLGLKVVPWTINARADMERAIDMGVDGLITDYPDRGRAVMAAKGLPLP